MVSKHVSKKTSYPSSRNTSPSAKRDPNRPSSCLIYGLPHMFPRRQTAADDDRDACTSVWPTPQALAVQRRRADVWYSPAARPRKTGRPMRTTARIPCLGPVRLSPQDSSPLVHSAPLVFRPPAPWI